MFKELERIGKNWKHNKTQQEPSLSKHFIRTEGQESCEESLRKDRGLREMYQKTSNSLQIRSIFVIWKDFLIATRIGKVQYSECLFHQYILLYHSQQ